MTNTDLHVEAVRRTYHHYHNYGSSHGHLSGGALVAIIVLAVIVGLVYLAYKKASEN